MHICPSCNVKNNEHSEKQQVCRYMQHRPRDLHIAARSLVGEAPNLARGFFMFFGDAILEDYTTRGQFIIAMLGKP